MLKKQHEYLFNVFLEALVKFSSISVYFSGKENILYQCGWSPLENQTFTYKVQTTLVNGHVVYDKGDFYTDRTGERLTFKR